MKYFKITWIHKFEDEPVQYYHELDDQNYEKRKIVFKRDGKCVIASNYSESDECILSPLPIPDISEINQDSQFIALQISQEEFEEVWWESIHKTENSRGTRL